MKDFVFDPDKPETVAEVIEQTSSLSPGKLLGPAKEIVASYADPVVRSFADIKDKVNLASTDPEMMATFWHALKMLIGVVFILVALGEALRLFFNRPTMFQHLLEVRQRQRSKALAEAKVAAAAAAKGKIATS